MQQLYNCPRCRQYIQWGIPQCNYCGCPINWGPPPPPQQTPSQQPVKIQGQQFTQSGSTTQPSTGQPTRMNPAAGQQTQLRQAARQQPRQPSNKRTKGTVIIVFCVLGLLACIAYIVYALFFNSGANFSLPFGTGQTAVQTSNQTQASGPPAP